MADACLLVITDLFAEMCEVLRESLRLRFDLLRVPLYLWDTNSLPVRLICVVFHFICGTRTYSDASHLISHSLRCISLYCLVCVLLQVARVVMLDACHMPLVTLLDDGFHDDAF